MLSLKNPIFTETQHLTLPINSSQNQDLPLKLHVLYVFQVLGCRRPLHDLPVIVKIKIQSFKIALNRPKLRISSPKAISSLGFQKTHSGVTPGYSERRETAPLVCLDRVHLTSFERLSEVVPSNCHQMRRRASQCHLLSAFQD